jgi:hypothetical protein
MINITIHANACGLEIVREYPENSCSVTLRGIGTEEEFTLYLPVEQWWMLRHCFPKAADYGFYHGPAAGDAHAKAFYDAYLAKTIETLRKVND